MSGLGFEISRLSRIKHMGESVILTDTVLVVGQLIVREIMDSQVTNEKGIPILIQLARI
jgi:hypothetical protein